MKIRSKFGAYRPTERLLSAHKSYGQCILSTRAYTQRHLIIHALDTGTNSAFRIGTRAHKLANRSTIPATTCTNDHNSIGRVWWHVHEAISHAATPHTHVVIATCSVSAIRRCLAVDGNSMMILMGQDDPYAASGRILDAGRPQAANHCKPQDWSRRAHRVARLRQ